MKTFNSEEISKLVEIVQAKRGAISDAAFDALFDSMKRMFVSSAANANLYEIDGQRNTTHALRLLFWDAVMRATPGANGIKTFLCTCVSNNIKKLNGGGLERIHFNGNGNLTYYETEKTRAFLASDSLNTKFNSDDKEYKIDIIEDQPAVSADDLPPEFAALAQEFSGLECKAQRRFLKKHAGSVQKLMKKLDCENLKSLANIGIAISNLPTTSRKCTFLHYICGWSHTQIANALGFAAPAVSNTMANYGIKILRRELEKSNADKNKFENATDMVQKKRIASIQNRVRHYARLAAAPTEEQLKTAITNTQPKWALILNAYLSGLDLKLIQKNMGLTNLQFNDKLNKAVSGLGAQWKRTSGQVAQINFSEKDQLEKLKNTFISSVSCGAGRKVSQGEIESLLARLTDNQADAVRKCLDKVEYKISGELGQKIWKDDLKFKVAAKQNIIKMIVAADNGIGYVGRPTLNQDGHWEMVRDSFIKSISARLGREISSDEILSLVGELSPCLKSAVVDCINLNGEESYAQRRAASKYRSKAKNQLIFILSKQFEKTA